jgi:hypothetical protein
VISSFAWFVPVREEGVGKDMGELGSSWGVGGSIVSPNPSNYEQLAIKLVTVLHKTDWDSQGNILSGWGRGVIVLTK